MVSEVRGDITADRCARCGGLWFDARELDAWLAREESPVAAVELELPRRGMTSRGCQRCQAWTDTSNGAYAALTARAIVFIVTRFIR